MKLNLPIQITAKDGKYREIGIKKPTSGVLADTRKAIDGGDPYRAMQVFISGCIESIGDITDKTQIRTLVASMPYKSAAFTVAEIFLLNNGDDGMEGLYSCPKSGCGKKINCELRDGIDTRDHFRALEIIETDKEFVSVALISPVDIKNTEGETVFCASSVSLVWPTLAHCAVAFGKVGGKDLIRLQIACLVEALTAVNETEIDQKTKSRYGSMMFERIDKDDMKTISKTLENVGVITSVNKTCPECGKIFEVVLEPLDFFVSSLR